MDLKKHTFSGETPPTVEDFKKHADKYPVVNPLCRWRDVRTSDLGSSILVRYADSL